MIIYNVTVSLSPEIEKDWLNWMKSKHIADVMKERPQEAVAEQEEEEGQGP